MGTLIISAILALVVLGFNSPVWWLAAAALLYLYARYVRTGQGSGPPGPPSTGGPSGRPVGGSGQSGGGSGGSARVDNNYRAYRQRRDQMAKWERRYRRERPWNTRK
ncbi:hypothetical protein QF026_006215 [Streptomyces aurantiacus]|uniref:hypothetical protein n=1 Tax=Streptomyces aurantiacus TaxID=47760 RepID=UPI0027915485|nr:hypothetical protein [Streptomyces aurantiacus]MDQ0777749.1 hypothetical protein [Streptomyces aurantiacus]